MMGLLTLSGGRCQCFPLLPSSATAITISQRCGEELITHSLTVELTASSRARRLARCQRRLRTL